VTRILTTLICLGLVLAISPVAAQLPENWTTVDILAVKWMSGSAVQEVQILDDETFHDAAIIKDGEELEWVLTCIQCDPSLEEEKCKACDVNLEFAILDLHFVADLDKLTHPYIHGVQGLPEDTGKFPELEKAPARGAKKWQFDGFDPYDPEFRKGRGEEDNRRIESKVELDPAGASSEVWKYTIVVEDPSSESNCLRFSANKVAELINNCSCDNEKLCDTWDPHVYTHPGRKK